MKSIGWKVLACTLVLAWTSPLVAGEKGRGKRPNGSVSEPQVPSRPVQYDGGKSKEPWLDVNVAISAEERRVISEYTYECRDAAQRGHKHKRLPPGLAKKVARGGKLPPGWQKKCVRGEIMPVEVYEQCHPLPREVAVKLPPPPPGTILVTIDGKVARLVKATLEILDVFDVL